MTAPQDIAITPDSPAVSGSVQRLVLHSSVTLYLGDCLDILPMLEDFPSADETADAARINRLIEDWARRAPEQYYWVHRRFKARPAGEPPVY